MTDLGTLPKETGDMPVPANPVSSEGSERKPSYPSLNFDGEQAQKAGLSKCAHGDEYEVTIRVKAKRIGGYGDEGDQPSVEFDVVSADTAKKVEGEEEDKPNGPRKPKGKALSPKEAGMAYGKYDDED